MLPQAKSVGWVGGAGQGAWAVRKLSALYAKVSYTAQQKRVDLINMHEHCVHKRMQCLPLSPPPSSSPGTEAASIWHRVPASDFPAALANSEGTCWHLLLLVLLPPLLQIITIIKACSDKANLRCECHATTIKEESILDDDAPLPLPATIITCVTKRDDCPWSCPAGETFARRLSIGHRLVHSEWVWHWAWVWLWLGLCWHSIVILQVGLHLLCFPLRVVHYVLL